jgi:hypothetical protein
MAFVIPSTKQQFENNLANLEGKLGQTSPINDKALLVVIAALEAGQYTTLFKWASKEAKGNLAITANREQLILIGNNYGISIKAAQAANYTITLPAITGTTIPITRDFVGTANGVRYRIDAAAIAVAGVATINVTAKSEGIAGNLTVGDTMSINTPVSGAETLATITVENTIGTDEEETEDYRIRVLDEIRAIYGGGNAADYRKWSQEVAGVRRAYPFAGKPIGSILASAPPDRTIYVETTIDIDPDGIAPGSLIDDVRASITADPETGISRQPLGLTDDTLYVESIIRTTLYFTIYDLIIDSNVEAQAKSDFETAIENYARSCIPYVDGLDSPIDNKSAITDPSVSKIAQDVFSSYGGSISGVTFGNAPLSSVNRYQLAANETVKSGGVQYV